MARKRITNLPLNTEIKLAVATWKIVTGKPQYQLAKQLGISPSQLSHIITGRRPGTKYIQRISEIAGKIAS